MSEKKLPEGVYGEAPNIVHIVFKDQSGEAERWVTGKTLDEVLESFGMSLYVPGPAKKRKPRRTKAEMEASADKVEVATARDDRSEGAPPHKGKKEPAWG